MPPPGYGAVRELPSYAVRIPFSDDGRSSFEPATIAIPADMTVIWFNDDQNPHTVTMNARQQVLSVQVHHLIQILYHQWATLYSSFHNQEPTNIMIA